MRHPIQTPDNDITQSEDEQIYIREIQEYLRFLSFTNNALMEIGVDGIFGPETIQAVQLFQRQSQMEETGQVDRPTWDLIYASYLVALGSSIPPLVPEGSSGGEDPAKRVG